MSEKWSEDLMDKLAGELSEKEAARFEQTTKQDDQLAEEFQFISEAWTQMEEFKVPDAPTSLSENFYSQLDRTIKKEEKSPINVTTRIVKTFFSNGGWGKNLSLGLFLLAFGFILGGKWNRKIINVNQTTVHTATSNDLIQSSYDAKNTYIPTTQKIAYIKSIPLTYGEDEGYQKLKETFQKEQNTNLKIASLREINEHYPNVRDLKPFLASQIEREQSPLVQVEMVNLIINNNRSKETIKTMESMLRKRQLNPVVEEKIRNDLPVLRASFVK